MNKTIAATAYYKIIDLKPDINKQHITTLDKLEYNKDCFNDISDLLEAKYNIKIKIKEIYANKDKGVIEITTIHNDKIKLIKSIQEKQ